MVRATRQSADIGLEARAFLAFRRSWSSGSAATASNRKFRPTRAGGSRALRPSRSTPLEKGRDDGADDFGGAVFWYGLYIDAALDFGNARFLGGYLEAVVRQVDVVRRIALPRWARITSIASGKKSCCGLPAACRALPASEESAPGLMAEYEAPLREMVEHRGVCGDESRVRMRKDSRCRLRA